MLAQISNAESASRGEPGSDLACDKGNRFAQSGNLSLSHYIGTEPRPKFVWWY